MGKRYGYGRVSSKGQAANGNSLEDQRSKLNEVGCDEIVLEAYTGATMDRPKFTALLAELEPGDTLIVCKLDRLARTAAEGSTLVKSLLDRGVSVHILNMGLIENTATGILILNVLLAFAEFERQMIVERTSEGKAVARATDPEWREGRKPMDVPNEYYSYKRRTDAGDATVVEACRALGISRSTWYKWAREGA